MIVVDNVSKYYGLTCAVRDLSFTINQGECVGFLGLNGAGKSTVLRILSSLLLPSSGHVTIKGLDVVDNAHQIRNFIGYLPESPPLYIDMTVKEYLEFAGSLRGLSSDRLRQRVKQVIRQCNLGVVRDTVIGNLSHGYRQRVGIGQAIIHQPDLLILDEPLQGLDPVQVVEMRRMIGQLRGEHTILLSTHYLAEIEQTCHRILMMHEGTIAAQGTESELARRYGTTRVIALEVRGTESALRQALSSLTEVSELEVEASEGDRLEVRLCAADHVREKVSKAIVNAGLGLLSMRSVTTGLESIFIQLSTGRQVLVGSGWPSPDMTTPRPTVKPAQPA
jgi:ABC-2 type transport system ATP-binding protein